MKHLAWWQKQSKWMHTTALALKQLEICEKTTTLVVSLKQSGSQLIEFKRGENWNVCNACIRVFVQCALHSTAMQSNAMRSHGMMYFALTNGPFANDEGAAIVSYFIWTFSCISMVFAVCASPNQLHLILHLYDTHSKYKCNKTRGSTAK